MRNGSYVSLAAAAAMLAAGCSSSTVSAEAGDDFVVTIGEAPTFDGCASSGDIDSYTWEIVEAPDTMADDAGKEIDPNSELPDRDRTEFKEHPEDPD